MNKGRVVALDHCYSLSPDKDPGHNQSNWSFVKVSSPQIILEPETIPRQVENLCIEMFVDDNAYTSYNHFMICYNFLGDQSTTIQVRHVTPKDQRKMEEC